MTFRLSEVATALSTQENFAAQAGHESILIRSSPTRLWQVEGGMM